MEYGTGCPENIHPIETLPQSRAFDPELIHTQGGLWEPILPSQEGISFKIYEFTVFGKVKERINIYQERRWGQMNRL